jgi:hypothetical protein
MANVNRFAERLIDLSERFADVVDAAEGKGPRKGGMRARWLLLPAAGAAAYGLATSSAGIARQTRGLMRRAGDLPDADLLNRVKEVTGSSDQKVPANGRRTPRSTSRPRSRTSQTQRRR